MLHHVVIAARKTAILVATLNKESSNWCDPLNYSYLVTEKIINVFPRRQKDMNCLIRMPVISDNSSELT